MDIISPFIGAIVEYTIHPIGRQLSYLFFIRRNIQNLKSRVETLKYLKESVLHKVNEARRNAENIESGVQNWLTKADSIIEKSETLLNNLAQQDGLCLNLVQRHKLSRKTVKLGDEVVEIKNEGNFDRVSYRVALLEVELESSKAKTSDFVNFESRKPTIDKIIGALMDDNVHKIGVYGMGGVGKTMLVKEISKLAMERKLFDEVVTSTISQTPDIKRIQGQLGDKLGLKFDQETEEGRALMLQKRLKMERRIFIVLDDVWKQIDLETIGIPSIEDQLGCKILFTSRDFSVLFNDMCADEIFEIKVLQEDETWRLFKKMGGEIVETSDLRSIAVEIARECARLPIAITTLAKTLRNKPLSIWKDALTQLKNPVVVNIRGMNEKVYSSLKLSYDQLDCEEAKLLLLLCSMFPEDCIINNVEHLHVYAMGMGFLYGVDTVTQARHRITKLVDDLISSSLLLKESTDGLGECVRMHDLIRDLAILIASKDDHIRTLSFSKGLDESWPEKEMSGDHTVVYLNVEGLCNPPKKLMLPKVQLLVLHGPLLLDRYELSKTFFQETKELKIVEIIDMEFSLETTTFHSFEKLQALHLFRCRLGNIDRIGHLNSLEILNFRGSNIRKIPMSISQLTQLKVLGLSDCSKLKVIPPNVLFNLKNLEELYLRGFDGWEREDLNEGRKNASLSELKHLVRLCVLTLWIQDENTMPKQLFSRLLNLEKFDITIGCAPRGFWSMEISRVLCLKMAETGTDIDNGINMLLKRSEELHLVGSVGARVLPFELKENETLHLKKLYIYDNSKFQHFNLEQKNPFQNVWSKLEYLKLSNLENLESIFHCDHVRGSQLNKLKVIKLLGCNKLRSLFYYSILDDLFHLEEIKIIGCAMMRTIVGNEKATEKIELASLKYLTLMDLPRLHSFFSKIEKHGQSCLDNLQPDKTSRNTDSFFNELDEIIPFRDGSKLFSRLKHLRLYGSFDYCQTHLPMRIVQILHNIEVFEVRKTFFEEVFPIERSWDNVEEWQNERYKLSRLNLFELPKLRYLWSGGLQKNSSIVQNLMELNVLGCGILSMSVPSSMSFRNLTWLTVRKCHKMTYLLNPSVARTLVQLRLLVLGECKRMTTVIVEGVEEENDEILFNRLDSIDLRDMLKLTSFHSGKCTIRFPCLDELAIENCPEMRDFSLGIVSTPLLLTENIGLYSETFEICPILEDSKEIYVSNINVTIRQVWEDHYDTNLRYLFEEENSEDNQCDPSSHVEE
ncbi:probable disease resistance protein At4g27220 isoform X2 [Cucumis melo]|uniref:Probable disease resistance protein At4g27220 isoform X2 n=1 Tax=Cucumis melo TaxID=3656 RepID=A0ABM3KT34_CUCME|nr:probable disease resistance protein At4g27220 isoform X2 [Cucumis melo]